MFIIIFYLLFGYIINLFVNGYVIINNFIVYPNNHKLSISKDQHNYSELFNSKEFDNNQLYIIISKYTPISSKIIDDLDRLSLKNIFLDIDYFSKDEIENLKNNYGYDKNINNIIILENEYLIGGIFELYSQIFI